MAEVQEQTSIRLQMDEDRAEQCIDAYQTILSTVRDREFDEETLSLLRTRTPQNDADKLILAWFEGTADTSPNVHPDRSPSFSEGDWDELEDVSTLSWMEMSATENSLHIKSGSNGVRCGAINRFLQALIHAYDLPPVTYQVAYSIAPEYATMMDDFGGKAFAVYRDRVESFHVSSWADMEHAAQQAQKRFYEVTLETPCAEVPSRFILEEQERDSSTTLERLSPLAKTVQLEAVSAFEADIAGRYIPTLNAEDLPSVMPDADESSPSSPDRSASP